MSAAEKLTVPEMEIVCENCGGDLVVVDESPYRNWLKIRVEPCEFCVNEAIEDYLDSIGRVKKYRKKESK